MVGYVTALIDGPFTSTCTNVLIALLLLYHIIIIMLNKERFCGLTCFYYKEPERKKLKPTLEEPMESNETNSGQSAASALTSKDYYFDSYSHFG